LRRALLDFVVMQVLYSVFTQTKILSDGTTPCMQSILLQNMALCVLTSVCTPVEKNSCVAVCIYMKLNLLHTGVSNTYSFPSGGLASVLFVCNLTLYQ
jgi:hypothetical protein